MGTEIERVWVLRAMPRVPRHAERWQIEQGYLPGDVDEVEFKEGRIRRIRLPDGRVECWHTIKRGSGIVREESERTITSEEFDRLWPTTVGRRIAKTRFRVRDGDVTWELDEIRTPPIVLLEIELPTERTPVVLPAWVNDLVVREVTHDPRYRNAALALYGIPASE